MSIKKRIQKEDCKNTIFYDGSCDMCSLIIKKIGNSPQADIFEKVDITRDTLPGQFSKKELSREIHLVDEKGQVHKNIDAVLKVLERYPQVCFTSAYRAVAYHQASFGINI